MSGMEHRSLSDEVSVQDRILLRQLGSAVRPPCRSTSKCVSHAFIASHDALPRLHNRDSLLLKCNNGTAASGAPILFLPGFDKSSYPFTLLTSPMSIRALPALFFTYSDISHLIQHHQLYSSSSTLTLASLLSTVIVLSHPTCGFFPPYPLWPMVDMAQLLHRQSAIGGTKVWLY